MTASPGIGWADPAPGTGYPAGSKRSAPSAADSAPTENPDPVERSDSARSDPARPGSESPAAESKRRMRPPRKRPLHPHPLRRLRQHQRRHPHQSPSVTDPAPAEAVVPGTTDRTDPAEADRTENILAGIVRAAPDRIAAAETAVERIPVGSAALDSGTAAPANPGSGHSDPGYLGSERSGFGRPGFADPGSERFAPERFARQIPAETGRLSLAARIPGSAAQNLDAAQNSVAG